MSQTRYSSSQKESQEKLLEESHLYLQKQSAIYEVATDNIQTQWQEVGHAVQDSWGAVSSSVEDTLADSMLGLNSWADATKSILRDVAREFVKTYILKGVVSGISGAIGGALGLRSASASPSFDGGGFTGIGPRSGGIDGKGGFSAILHPNETVVDHAKGQSAGGESSVIVQQTINVTTGIQQTVRTEIANMLPQIANAAKSAVLDARQRGGSFSGAFS